MNFEARRTHSTSKISSSGFEVGVLALLAIEVLLLTVDRNELELFSLDLLSGVSGGVAPMGGPSPVTCLPLIC